VQAVEREYREAAASNVRAAAWANPLKNFQMAVPTYTRTDRVGELYEQRFYANAWGDRPRRGGRIAMRDLLIEPKGFEGRFDPDVENPRRHAPVPILLVETTTLNTGHNWRFEAMYMGEPPRQGTADQSLREDVDKNTILARTKWADLPEACRDFPLGGAVAASACVPGGFPPMQVRGSSTTSWSSWSTAESTTTRESRASSTAAARTGSSATGPGRCRTSPGRRRAPRPSSAA
jgi:NTE family protein